MKLKYDKFLSNLTQFMKASEIRELLKLVEKKRIISLAGGLPDPNSFPIEELAKIAQEVIEVYGKKALQYAPTRGVTMFREVLMGFVAKTRGIKVPSIESIIITSGSQQSLDIISRTLIDPGDVVLVELPSYLAAINAFKIQRPEFVGIPLDNNGLRVDILEEKLKKAKEEGKKIKFLYTVPIAHNPAGVTMSIERKKRLIELAEEYDFLIVEDDVYGLLVFEKVDTTPIKLFDKSGRVIYIASFSKILSPGLRLGYIIAEEPLVDVFERAKQSMDLHTSSLSQFIAIEVLRKGVIEKNLPRVREMYRKKRDVMLDAIEENFPEGSLWSRPVGGLFIFAWTPKEIDTYKLLPKAVEKGVAYVPGKPFFVDGSGTNTMRLNFSYPTEDDIKKGIEILGKLLKEELSTRYP